jgi:hypothetical protein
MLSWSLGDKLFNLVGNKYLFDDRRRLRHNFK